MQLSYQPKMSFVVSFCHSVPSATLIGITSKVILPRC